jgi:hypothetical protein
MKMEVVTEPKAAPATRDTIVVEITHSCRHGGVATFVWFPSGATRDRPLSSMIKFTCAAAT